MSMDYANERYVRQWTRDTLEWKLLSWEARVVRELLRRKVDRAGVLGELDEHAMVESLAAMLDLPLEIVSKGEPQLIARGVIVKHGNAYTIPDFHHAETVVMSDGQRQAKAREKRRAEAMGVTSRDEVVTPRDGAVTIRDEKSLLPFLPSGPVQPDPEEEGEESSLSAPPAPACLTAPARRGKKTTAKIAELRRAGVAKDAISASLEKYELDKAAMGRIPKDEDAAIALWLTRERWATQTKKLSKAGKAGKEPGKKADSTPTQSRRGHSIPEIPSDFEAPLGPLMVFEGDGCGRGNPFAIHEFEGRTYVDTYLRGSPDYVEWLEHLMAGGDDKTGHWVETMMGIRVAFVTNAAHQAALATGWRP